MRNSPESISKIGHFYFCLLVGIRMHIKRTGLSNEPVMKRFVSKWLNDAKKHKIFDTVVSSDILWLQNEIISKPFPVFYKQIRNIYNIINSSEKKQHQKTKSCKPPIKSKVNQGMTISKFVN